MEDGDSAEGNPAPRDPADRYDVDRYQRSSATVLFWVLVAALGLVGICVLISLFLVLTNGS